MQGFDTGNIILYEHMSIDMGRWITGCFLSTVASIANFHQTLESHTPEVTN
jgi:hypothetical protein